MSDEKGTLGWAKDYALTYWQGGNEPESQAALTILSRALQRNEAHDAEVRQAVLVEVAEWLESFGHYDNIADQVRYLYPHTPQGRAGTGHRATQGVPAGDWSSESSAAHIAAINADAKRLANNKSLAHVTFRGDAVCGAELTGASPVGLDKCEACIDALIDRIVAHDLDVAHAEALERAAIVSHLRRGRSKHYDEFVKWGDPSEQERGIAYDMAWQEVQNGAHNRRAGE